MRLLISIILVTVVVMIVLPVISTGMSTTNSEYVTYNHDEHEYKFTYPASWGEVEHLHPYGATSDVGMYLGTIYVKKKEVLIMRPGGRGSWNIRPHMLSSVSMGFSVRVDPAPGRSLMEEINFSPLKDAYYLLLKALVWNLAYSEKGEKIILNGRKGYSFSGWLEDSNINDKYWQNYKSAYFFEDGFFYRIYASVGSSSGNYIPKRYNQDLLTHEAELDEIFNSFEITSPPPQQA